jgi:hypothetical protein
MSKRVNERDRPKRRLWYQIAAALLVAALPAAAHAEPKVITIDGCAKVEQEIRREGDRTAITVKCTGEANDPKVREEAKGLTGLPPNSLLFGNGTACIRGDGKAC